MLGFNKKSTSVQTAKNRLQVLLTTDRANCTPDNLNHLRSDILNLISRYMSVDSKNTKVCMKQNLIDNEYSSVLYIQIPIEYNK